MTEQDAWETVWEQLDWIHTLHAKMVGSIFEGRNIEAGIHMIRTQHAMDTLMDFVADKCKEINGE